MEFFSFKLPERCKYQQGQNNCSLQILRVASKEYNIVRNVILWVIKLCSVRKPVRGTTRQRPHAVASKLAQVAAAGGEASTAGNCFGQCSEIRSALALCAELQLLHLFVNETTFVVQEYKFLPFKYAHHAVTNNYFHLVCNACKTCCGD